MRGDDLQRAALSRRRSVIRRCKAFLLRLFVPGSNGVALPLRFFTVPIRPNEMKQARLLAGVGFEFQSLVILPSDMNARGQAHDTACAVGFTGPAGGFIFLRIPSVC